MKRIEVTVLPTGESRVETKGFSGDSCRDASKFIEAALGRTAAETLKPEFHAQNPTQNPIENSN